MHLAPVGPPPPPCPPASAEDLPQTMIKRTGQARGDEFAMPPGGLAIPSARRMGSRVPAPVPEGIILTPPPRTGSTYSRLRKQDTWQNLLVGIPILLLLAGVGAFLYDHYRPRKALPRLAAQYLDSLSRQDISGAYALLSRESRAHCTQEEFQALRDRTPWTWSDIEITRLEDDAAVVKYRLNIAGKAPSDDFLTFLREGDAWVRPFNWNLLQRAEQAFARNDPDMALLLAQAAVRINPRDPVARGYLCEAVYYRRVPGATQKECSLALELSRTYPSKLSTKSLYHLHAILADNYKNLLRKYPEALEQYDVMLAFPNLSAADQCDILLARGDTRIAMGQKEEAQEDMRQAARLCSRPADLDFIRRKQDRLRTAQ